MIDKKDILKIKAALENQQAKKDKNYRKMELSLVRFLKYGGHRELIDLYTKEDLEKAKRGEIY